MRLIILTTLFLLPLIGFASFPIQTTTPSDTIIETKKETIEEYNIRIQKQLYKRTETKYKNSIKENIKPRSFFPELILIVAGVITFLIGDYINYTTTTSIDGLTEMAFGFASFSVGIIILLVKSIRRKIIKDKKGRGSLNLKR